LPPETVSAVLDAPVEERVPRFAPDSAAPPRTSIVMVTVNGLFFTRLCLEYLLASTPEADVEIIVVDNGSTDGTVAYLETLSARDARVRLRANSTNAGFGAATNQGAALARGEVLLLLNNDTIVPAGAVAALARHLDDRNVGIVGAVTNRAGNEAQIEVPYRTCGELVQFAADHTHRHAGELFDIRTVTMFCAALRRDVWDAIGPLDERFEIGMFEDDDYAMRVRATGCRVACAEDVFVHHFGQASIGRLASSGEYGRLFHANRVRWEEKWGTAWEPYQRRDKPAYRELVERVRQVVSQTVPWEATVLVITKGDAELLKLGGRRAWHFPQLEDGTYSGYHPADSAACIAELERLRALGAEFLVIPPTASWWLQHYGQFREHLQSRYRLLRDAESTAIVAL
jgi:GT2 family glycosyltransferase